MPDREKVLRALGICTQIEPEDECPHGCPYKFENGCIRGVMKDALELLNEQEPRVLTLEEATGEDECWFEHINGSNGYADVYCDWNGSVWASRINKIMSSMIQAEAYGKQWRCWSARPTDEQRKAVKWNAQP